MRLIRATVDHYRVHEHVEVDFHPRTSLLGGLNEAGKSTLIEALHRALFLPAKGDTQVHKDMRREGSSDRPAVRLEFEQEGKRWDLHKHFGGNQRFSVTLRTSGEAPLEGDDAEARLAELTGAALPRGKRATDESVRQPWSHLWVWQGGAGDDPSGAIAATTDELVRIAAEGAGALLMSELDSRLAERFRAEHEATHGAGKAVLKSSELGRAQQRHDELERQAAVLAQRVDALAHDADRYADAVERLAHAEPKALEVTAQIDALEIDIRAGEAVQQRYDAARQHLDALNARSTELHADARQLDEWSAAAAALREKLANDRDAHRLAAARDEAVRLRNEANAALLDARAALPPLIEARDGAASRLRRVRAEKDVAAAEKASARIVRIEQELQSARSELADLPEITAEELATLRQQSDALTQGEQQLKSLASTLEVLHATRTPTLNGKVLQAGERIALSPESVLALDAELSLRLIVPGAADAERLRAELDDQRAVHERALARFVAADASLRSVDRLAELLPRRTALLARAAEHRQRLAEEDADGVRAELSRAQDELTAARSADSALSGETASAAGTDPSTFEAAVQSAELTVRQLAEHERSIGQHQARLTAADAALARSADERDAHAQTRRADEDELRKMQALMDDRLRHHDGDRAALQRAHDRVKEQVAEAEEQLRRLQGDLQGAALDVLTTRHARLVEQRDRLRTTVDRARDDMNESRGRLHQTDGSDPDSELRDVRDRLERARAVLASATLDARASTLLDTLYRQGLNAANERVTRPLAETVGHYLRHLFGPDAGVNVRYADGKLGEFYLSRPGFAEYEEPFHSLSGGAREQVAAAVRLATAELLAARHGGTLPVVFDDAFVNTDPGRIEKVIDMLYHAGERGLQVIVGTCDPDRYQNLGQVQWRMQRGHGAREA